MTERRVRPACLCFLCAFCAIHPIIFVLFSNKGQRYEPTFVLPFVARSPNPPDTNLSSPRLGTWRRARLWKQLFDELQPLSGAEVGVWKGHFASVLVPWVPSLRRYYLVDPWQHQAEWNKPFNVKNETFENIFLEAMQRTRDSRTASSKKYVVMRGFSQDMARKFQDGQLDFVYLDGDHTANGTIVDLIAWYPKVRPGGLICGDDYTDTERRGVKHEATRVKSVVDLFAAATGSEVQRIGALQFYFRKPSLGRFHHANMGNIEAIIRSKFRNVTQTFVSSLP